MQLAMCHYSLNRRWQAEGWDIDRLCTEVAALGLRQLDVHSRLAAEWMGRPAEVAAALRRHGLTLAGLSIGNSFLQPDRAAFDREVERVRGLIRACPALGARTARVFGGWLPDAQRLVPRARAAGLQQVLDGLAAVTATAAECGVVLALENHGCLPGTSAEVMFLLGAVDSPHLRATIDLGNFLDAGEEPAHGAAALAPFGAYVHVKWLHKVADPAWPWGWRTAKAGPGEGAVDLDACFAALARSGFTGTVAIEYEGEEDERTAVPRAVETVRAAMARHWPAEAAAH